MPPKQTKKPRKQTKKSMNQVVKFYEKGMADGMEYMPIAPPMDYSTDRMNPIVPLPMNPYPTSPFQ